MAPRRPAPGVPILDSTPRSRDLNAVIWAFCEGRNTEIGWLDYIRVRCRDIGVRINYQKGCGVPFTVVQRASEKRLELNRDAKGAELRDEVWAVFDRDEHPRVEEAISICRKNGIGLVFSNACFELWPYMHFGKEVFANIHRHALQGALKDVHPFYDHSSGAMVDWQKLIGQETQAINFAIRAHSRAVNREEGPFENPYTTAWLLQMRLLNACDNKGEWLTDLISGKPKLDGLTQYLAQPLRQSVEDHIRSIKKNLGN